MFTYSGELRDFDAYDYKLLSELDAQSQHSKSTADFLQGNAHAISEHIEALKTQVMSESIAERQAKARALELEIYQLQINGRAHGEHYDLGYLTQWRIENPQYSAFLKEVNKIYERKQRESGWMFARSYTQPELYYWLLANPAPSPFRASVEQVYRGEQHELHRSGEHHVATYSTPELVLWLEDNPSPSLFRNAVEAGLQKRQGRIFGGMNRINHIYGWLAQNPGLSPFREGVEEVYKEKIIEDLLVYDGSKSDDWWNNPDAQLEYFYSLMEELGRGNMLKEMERERGMLLAEVPRFRELQQRFWGLSHPQQNFKDIEYWREAVRANPYVEAGYKTYERELANWEEAETNARRHADNKAFRRRFGSIAGIAAGAFVSMLIPGAANALLPNIIRGAAFGATSSVITKGNIVKGTFQGAFFAGVGNVLGQVMSKVGFLKEAHRVQGFIQTGVTGALSAELNGGKVFENMLISIACQGVTQEFSSLTPYERAFMKSALATVLKGGDLGMALMAGSIGVLESVVQDSGETLGNSVRGSIVETQKNRPVAGQNTESRNTHVQNEEPSIIKQPLILGDADNSNGKNLPTNNSLSQKQKLKEIQEFFGVNSTTGRDAAGMADDILISINPNHKKFFAGRFLPKKQNKSVDFLAANRELAKARAVSGKSTKPAKRSPLEQFNSAMLLTEQAEDVFSNPRGQAALTLGAVADTVQLGVEFAMGLAHSAVIAEELEQPCFRQDAAFKAYLDHAESIGGWDNVARIGRNYVHSLGERLSRAEEKYAKGDYFTAGMLGNPLRSALEIGTLGSGAVGGAKLMMGVSKAATKMGVQGLEFAARGTRQFVHTHDFRSPVIFQFNAFEVGTQRPWGKKELKANFEESLPALGGNAVVEYGKWFPQRGLPRDTKHKIPIPDPEAVGTWHTQVGIKKGRSGYIYPQAREFGPDNKPIKDVDFTNHKRGDHVNPHQHRYLPNKTGGTPKREEIGQPLDNSFKSVPESVKKMFRDREEFEKSKSKSCRLI